MLNRTEVLALLRQRKKVAYAGFKKRLKELVVISVPFCAKRATIAFYFIDAAAHFLTL